MAPVFKLYKKNWSDIPWITIIGSSSWNNRMNTGCTTDRFLHVWIFLLGVCTHLTCTQTVFFREGKPRSDVRCPVCNTGRFEYAVLQGRVKPRTNVPRTECAHVCEKGSRGMSVVTGRGTDSKGLVHAVEQRRVRIPAIVVSAIVPVICLLKLTSPQRATYWPSTSRFP